MDQSCESPLITSETGVCACHVMQTMCVSDCLSDPAESDGVAESAGSQHRQWAMSSPVTRPGVLWRDHRSTNRRGVRKIRYQRDTGEANSDRSVYVPVALIRPPSMATATAAWLPSDLRNSLWQRTVNECQKQSLMRPTDANTITVQELPKPSCDSTLQQSETPTPLLSVLPPPDI